MVGEKMKDLGGKMEQAGKDLTMKVTAPIVAAGTVAVKNFAEVDKTMTLANQTMGNTAEEAELLDRAMSEAASNSTFGMSDAAQAVLNFARAGLDAQQAAQALAPAMNLAAGEGGNLDTVSAGLVATINGFQDGFDQASRYADVFAAACNNSALDVNSLSDAMSVAAPIFHAAGYSVEDAALYMGVMANNGVDASTAANSLKTGMARLAKPAKEGAEMLDKLGISVFNADGTMKDSVEVQKLLHDSFATLSEQEQIAAASAIFGKNNMSSWLALINTAPGDVEELSESLHDAAGTTDEMSEAMMSGFGGSIEKLKSSIDVLMYTLGKLAAEYLAPVIEKIQAAAEKFMSLDNRTKDLIVRALGIAAAIGPILIVGGKLMQGIGSILTFVPKLVGGIGSLIGALGPWGLAIAAAIAIGILLYQNWDTIKEWAGRLAEAVRTAWENMKQKISEVWDNLKEKTSNAMVNIKETISNKWESIKTGVTNKVDAIRDKVSTTFENIKTKAENVWESIKTGITSKIEAARDAVRNAIDRMKSFFNFQWSLPHIALPHFSISGSFSLNPPSIPHFSVSWYKKAMDGGMILNNPTIFGMMNGQLLGGGEAGPEAVVGTQSLMDMIRRAVAAVETAMTINYGGVTINVYGAEGQSISELADEIEERINFGVAKKTAAWA
ncbi:MAG: phage tail tape measure protein [Clostridia bacterium]|nr:phage tail tape measure protein [Clostridia bacterium]